jgi:hypothetical protein
MAANILRIVTGANSDGEYNAERQEIISAL